MKSLLCINKHTSIALLCLASLGLIACKETSTDPPKQRHLAGVNSLSAFSDGPNSVGLTWTATSATNTGYMADHELIVRAGAETLQTLIRPILSTGASIQGLTEGTIYSFAVTVRGNETSPYENSLPVTINWSPATRYTDEAGTSASLRLYESSSTENMHALRFYSDSVSGPRLISLSSSERSTMDVYLHSTQTVLLLRSGDLYNQTPTGRDTKFSDREPQSASSLSNPQPFAPATSSYTLDGVNIPAGTATSGLIFFARTEDNHYVRILVLRGSNGALIQGAAPDRYITVHISYQSVPGIQYAHYDVSSMGSAVSTVPVSPS